MGRKEASKFMGNLGQFISNNIDKFFGNGTGYLLVVFRPDSPESGRFTTNIPQDKVSQLMRQTADSIDGAASLADMKVEGEA